MPQRKAAKRAMTRRAPAPEVAATDDQAEAIGRLLEEFGTSGVVVKLERQSATPPRIWLYLNRVPFTTDLIDEVKEQYGGGSFRGQLYDGQTYLRKVFHFAIAGRPRDGEPEQASPRDDRLTRIETVLERMADKPAQNGLTEGVTLVTTLLAALKPIMSPPAAPTGTDTATIMKLVQDAEARGQALGRELGELKAGGGSSSDGMGEVLKTYLPPILTLMSQNQQQRTNNPPPVAAAPPPPEEERPALAPPIPAAPSQPLEPEYAWLEGLRPYYGMLAAQADDEHSDATVIADFALMKFDDGLLDAVHAASKRPDFHAIMRREFAAIAMKHPEWLDEFLARIVEGSTPDEPAPPPPPPSKRGKKP